MKMGADKSKSKTKVRPEGVKDRHFGVILEHIESQVGQISEGHAALDKKIDDFRHETRSEIGFLKLGLSNVSHGLKDLSAKVDRSEDDIKKIIADYFSAMDDELKHISKELAALKNRFSEKADQEYVHSIEKRVVVLEGELLKLRKF